MRADLRRPVPSSRQTLTSHTSFINDLAFSPDGDLLASVGGDGKVFLYDGAEGETKASAGDKSSGSLVRRRLLSHLHDLG